jgi:hypothetical protein
LREECRQRLLRTVFGPKRDKVTREWRKLHNEELGDQYSSPNIVQFMKVRDRLCGLVVRVSGYRYRGLGFDPRRYQIF